MWVSPGPRVSCISIYSGAAFDGYVIPEVERFEDLKEYEAPKEIILQLPIRMFFLTFLRTRRSIFKLRSGMELQLDGEFMRAELQGCTISVLKCSKSCVERLGELQKKGYQPYKAVVCFIVAWKGENDDNESAVILPDLYLRK